MEVYEIEEGAQIAGLWLRPGRKVVKDADGTMIAVHQGTKSHLTFVYKDDKAEFSFETLEEDEGGAVRCWKVEMPNKKNYFFGHGQIDPNTIERAKAKIRNILPLGPWASEDKDERVLFF
ncbi:MAG: hypothetical protein IT557_19155 [Alphaproteobacteria bacterium]|nr:hypothetical protein [Alphaproteobacteria bacterium]